MPARSALKAPDPSTNMNIFQFPVDPVRVPARVRIEHGAALARIQELAAICQRRGWPRWLRKLREINALLGGKPLPVATLETA